MASRDLLHRIKSVISVTPAALASGATNGAGVDTTGFESVTLEAVSGAQGGTSPVLTFKLQDSPDNTTWTDVAAGSVLGAAANLITVAATSTGTLGYLGSQRYVRAVANLAGTTPTATAGATIILSHARHNDPQTAQA